MSYSAFGTGNISPCRFILGCFFIACLFLDLHSDNVGGCYCLCFMPRPAYIYIYICRFQMMLLCHLSNLDTLHTVCVLIYINIHISYTYTIHVPTKCILDKEEYSINTGNGVKSLIHDSQNYVVV